MKSRLLIITLAVLLAALGAVAVLAYAHQANERAIAGLKTTTVLSAKDKIPSRTSLASAERQRLVVSEKLPADSVPSGALRSTAGLTSFVFDAAVQPGEVLVRPMLVSAAASTSASVLNVPAGMDVVTIQMCDTEAVDGYLVPGSDVTVFVTLPKIQGVSLQRSCSVSHAAQLPNSTQTAVVLQRVQVLSVTQGLASAASATSSAVSVVIADPAASTLSQGAEAVTFAVTAAEAARLIGACQTGLPYLALLPPTH